MASFDNRMSSLTALPKRVKGNYIEKCQKVPMTTNLFRLNLSTKTKIFLYSLKTSPSLTPDNIKKVKLMLSQHKSTMEKMVGPFVMDGRMIYGTNDNQQKRGSILAFEAQS